MRRFHLFEFTDIGWWPQTFRDLLTDFLRTFIGLTQPFSRKIDLIVKALDESGQSNVVDLCSGTGGPWPHLVQQLRDECGRDIEVLLTDKFPSADSETISSDIDGVEYYQYPIDAMNVPEEITGVRTSFDGFHHFPPEQAKKIIENAISSGQAIVIFEILQRNIWNIIGALTAPIAVFFMGFLTRPVSFARILFTYVIPIAPIVITWDSLVSQARCYTPEELLIMSDEAGSYRDRGVPVTYLVGYPKSD